jgi:ribokinase
MDMIAYVPRLPKMGETLHGTDFKTGFGGKGANQAVAAAKLGASVAMVTKLGADPNGHATADNFRAVGVDGSHILFTDNAPTGVAPISVDVEGNNSIVVVMGANDELTADEVEDARALITSASLMVCQLEIPPATSLAALRIAKEEGVTTILNTAPAHPPDQLDYPAFLECTDILCANEPEAELLTGMSVGTMAGSEAVAAELLRQMASGDDRHVVLTLGSRGALLASRAGGGGVEYHHIPATADSPTDTVSALYGPAQEQPSGMLSVCTATEQTDDLTPQVGAGDAFVGALASSLAADKTAGRKRLLDAIARANIASGNSVTKQGTQTSFPSRSELPTEHWELASGIEDWSAVRAAA